jgi:hypothetical protein
MVAGLKSLIDQFGKNMKPRDREKLRRAMDGLG